MHNLFLKLEWTLNWEIKNSHKIKCALTQNATPGYSNVKYGTEKITFIHSFVTAEEL